MSLQLVEVRGYASNQNPRDGLAGGIAQTNMVGPAVDRQKYAKVIKAIQASEIGHFLYKKYDLLGVGGNAKTL